MWAQAKHIANDMLDGKMWMPEVGQATHYHAYWVHPGWVHEMKKIYKLGVHTFYRPRALGRWFRRADLGRSGATSAEVAAAAATCLYECRAAGRREIRKRRCRR